MNLKFGFILIFMKILTLLLLVSATSFLSAGYYPDAGSTTRNTLNDLLGRVTYLPVPPEDELVALSRIQEELVVFEKRMHGDGLPPIFAKAFSLHYGEIRDALIEDRIDEDYGRDLLSIHRQLLDRTHRWLASPHPDPAFGEEMLENLVFFAKELRANSVVIDDHGTGYATPMVNGYQLWLNELIAWASECHGLNAGLISRLSVQLRNLEYYEAIYKRDGIVYPNEHEHLHERFLDVARETFAILGRAL